MPMKELFFFMVLKQNKQEYFNRVARVQDVLKQLGVIELEKIVEPDAKKVQNTIRNCAENEYILTRITKKFTVDTFHARGFRDDHYVLVKPNELDFKLYNDIPEATDIVTAEQFLKAYDGEYLKLTILRNLDKKDEILLFKKRNFKPEKQVPFMFYEKDFNDVTNLGIGLTNMMGVYKTLRYRMAEYYGEYIDTSFISKEEIEQLYSMLAYYNLKKISFTKYYEILSRLNNIDIEIIDTLREKLEEKSNVKRTIK